MKKKVKVLQVIPKLGFGGAETGCYDLAHFLPEKGFKSYIATSGGELLKFIDKKKVTVFKIPVNSKNPILILLNTFIISIIILFFNINFRWFCRLINNSHFFRVNMQTFNSFQKSFP